MQIPMDIEMINGHMMHWEKQESYVGNTTG